jgi:hypothetical protein
MKGRRLPDGYHYRDAQAGDYWRQILWVGNDPKPPDELADNAVRGRDFEWCICDPKGQLGHIGKHEVVEHEDGTITVSPSILSVGKDAYHGFLEHGVWREA